MPIEFSQMAVPNQMTTELAVLIVSIIALIFQAGYQLKNFVILFLGGFTVIILILTFTIALDFVWFWIVVLLDVIAIPIMATARFMTFS